MPALAQPWKKMLETRKESEKNGKTKIGPFSVVTGLKTDMSPKQELANKREKAKAELTKKLKAKEDLDRDIEALRLEIKALENELGR